MTQDTTPKRGRPSAWAQRQAAGEDPQQHESNTPFGRSWNATPTESRRRLASNRGLPAEVGEKMWDGLTKDEQALVETGMLPTIAPPVPKEELDSPPASDVLRAQIETLAKQVKSLNEQFLRLRNEYNIHVSHHDTPQMPSRGAVR